MGSEAKSLKSLIYSLEHEKIGAPKSAHLWVGCSKTPKTEAMEKIKPGNF